MKGLVLAGGSGSRLYPATKYLNKHLLPVFSKPLIYYPLSTLMLAGVREIGIVVNPKDIDIFSQLISLVEPLGITAQIIVQDAPKGIVHGLLAAADFLDGEDFTMILGDNIFHGGLTGSALAQLTRFPKASIFVQEVRDPQRYGILELDDSGTPVSIIEKPKLPTSNLAVSGLYMLPGDSVAIARAQTPSARSELEITDLLSVYLSEGRLNFHALPRGTVWFDAGTVASLSQASAYVEAVETRQNTGIGFPEEVALNLGLIDKMGLKSIAESMPTSQYRSYLELVAFQSR